MRSNLRCATAVVMAVVVTVVALPGAVSAAPNRLTGRILVYDADPDVGVRSILANGREPRRLFLALSWDGYPDYSPDGTRITYASGSGIWVADFDGVGRRTLVDGLAQARFPRWAPGGTEIGFAQPEITATTVVGRFEQSVSRPVFGPVMDWYTAFDWSPDGRYVAVNQTWYVTDDRGEPIPAGDIWIVRADGSHAARRLTARETAWQPGRLAWSPDGQTLAVEEGRGDLWTVKVGDGAVTNLTATPDVVESSPIWSPDGRWLAYGRADRSGSGTQLWIRPGGIRGGPGSPVGMSGEPTSWRAY